MTESESFSITGWWEAIVFRFCRGWVTEMGGEQLWWPLLQVEGLEGTIERLAPAWRDLEWRCLCPKCWGTSSATQVCALHRAAGARVSNS